MRSSNNFYLSSAPYEWKFWETGPSSKFRCEDSKLMDIQRRTYRGLNTDCVHAFTIFLAHNGYNVIPQFHASNE